MTLCHEAGLRSQLLISPRARTVAHGGRSGYYPVVVIVFLRNVIKLLKTVFECSDSGLSEGC